MKFGLSKEQYNYIKNTVVTPLEGQGAQVYCYGSRARGDHRKFSDLDIMVEGSTDLTQLMSKMRETLTESNFPYKVDLVQLKDFANTYKDGYERDKKAFR